MTDQERALRLAERLERRRLTRWVHATGETPRASGYVVDQDCAEAADELRRLHALNEELLEALKLALSAHGVMLLSDPPQEAWKTYGVEQKARAAIAKAEGEQP